MKNAPFLLAIAWAASLPALAEKQTVCTITVNSADEREVFRRNLPSERFEFVELVERGRPDWLSSSCRRGVRCDILVVSGHFAGTEFYSSKFDVDESLKVDEVERAQCSESCPGLFSQLKEVYLFGCDTLKPDPVRSAAPEIIRGLVRAGSTRADAERVARTLSERRGEASRDLMRRLFPNVPVIYGFSSLAPYGRVAGPMLDRYFEAGYGVDIGSGRPSAAMLKLFGPASMTFTPGMRETDANADYRAESCRFHDDRVTRDGKLELVRRSLGAPMPEMRMGFDRAERFLSAITPAERAVFEADLATRDRYLGIVRETEDPALRVRMIALARNAGWVDAPGERQEMVRLIRDMMTGDAMSFGEVDLICTLNRDGALDNGVEAVKASSSRATAHAAALACLGNGEARAQVIRALASPREQDVQIAQAFLRHRPMDTGELRAAALGIAQMKGSGAQVRALEVLARHHVSDSQVLDELARLYATTTSLPVQRAIAEVFLRSGPGPMAPQMLVALLRQHRLPSQGSDLIDTLIAKLAS